MLILTVTACCGRPLAQPLSASFDASGGTIGRAETNHFVLPDPERTVSRLHARIDCRNQRWWVHQRGVNPILVNGKPVEAGQEAGLSDGDRLQIGMYDVSVHVPVPAMARAEGRISEGRSLFAGLLDDVGYSTAPAAIEAASATGTLRDLVQAPLEQADPLQYFRTPKDAMRQPQPRTTPPEGTDPATWPPVNAEPVAAQAPVANPLDEPVMAPNTVHAENAWESLVCRSPEPPPATLPDRGMEIRRAFTPPSRCGASATSQHAPTVPEPFDASPGSRPGVDRPTDPPPLHPTADVFVLRAAFSRGTGVPESELPAFTPEFVVLIGSLLREALQGTVDLLVARQMIKHELHAKVTMIEPQGNNPLKRAANADAALRDVLKPPVRGYLGGREAMHDAFDDLRAHQLGFVAGMRASIAGLLARFSPEQLETSLDEPSMLDTLLPHRRIASRWERFKALYTRLSHDAEEDFHALFGKAFVAAYEEAIERLKKR